MRHKAIIDSTAFDALIPSKADLGGVEPAWLIAQGHMKLRSCSPSYKRVRERLTKVDEAAGSSGLGIVVSASRRLLGTSHVPKRGKATGARIWVASCGGERNVLRAGVCPVFSVDSHARYSRMASPWSSALCSRPYTPEQGQVVCPDSRIGMRCIGGAPDGVRFLQSGSGFRAQSGIRLVPDFKSR